ncbi:MAG: SurA N-terminal domain-containing protein [Hyphomicrobiaceae bacterium]|nr:SurA N-terminal domain-containing protein [Hyphomicrobiaceae bacterium]
MLDAMRRGAQGWVAKFLFAILILSFAVWGVADVFTGRGRTSLATVGDSEISPADFQRAFSQELSAISRQAGQRITTEQARAFGLDQRVMQRLVGAAAVDSHVGKLGLALSTDELIEGLKTDPSFFGADGKYSRQVVQSIMDQLDLSERGFFELRRKEELRRQLTGSIVAGIAAPAPLIDAIHAYREEKRVISFFRIDPDKVVKVAAADEAKLKAVYDANKSEFVTPALRKLAVLVLSIDDLKKRVAVSDDEIKSVYEAERATYDTPEKRRIQQIAFKDMAAAEAASTAIRQGKSFADAAKDAGAKESDIDLGLLTRSQIIDPKIADVAFGLAKDAVSAPVQGRFATVLLRVTAIEPGTSKTLADVKDKVREKIAAEKAQVEAHKLHDEVDDGRSGGKTLKQIAEALGLTFAEVAETDRTNKTSDGKTALELPNADLIIAGGFEAQVGVEQEPVALPDGGYAWIDALSVTAPQQKAFDAVKDAVAKLYEKDERARQLREAADKMAARVRAGEALAAVAADAGGNVETLQPITRVTTPQGLSRPAVAQAFALLKGGASSAESPDQQSRSVFRVDDIVPAPEPTKEQREKLAKEIGGEMENDIISTYVAGLEARLGVNIDRAALDRLTGGTTQ